LLSEAGGRRETACAEHFQLALDVAQCHYLTFIEQVNTLAEQEAPNVSSLELPRVLSDGLLGD